MKTILITGGCGFIGSNFIRFLHSETDWRMINLDKLTYAGNLENTGDVSGDRLRFVHGDIVDPGLVQRLIEEEKPWAIVNFAAESHVDRSILSVSPFTQTNICGVQALLEAVRNRPVERFLHISTDEVYGDRDGKPVSTEESALCPSSPYAATKAAADLLCFAYRRTYGLPVIVTRSSNNYGSYQFPEKLIPLLIRNGLDDLDLPIYGDGRQIRDWLFVEDNCRALLGVLERGRVGSVYNIGTGEERSNLDVFEALCGAIGDLAGSSAAQLKKRVRFVPDRPGHDRRYALETTKIRREIGWTPQVEFSSGLRKTVQWYLEHRDWLAKVTSGEYRKYYDSVYREGWGRGQSAEGEEQSAKSKGQRA